MNWMNNARNGREAAQTADKHEIIYILRNGGWYPIKYHDHTHDTRQYLVTNSTGIQSSESSHSHTGL